MARLALAPPKRLDSPYLPGARSPDWIKTPLRRRADFVIGGWIPGHGANRHTVGAILLGAHAADGQLRFCGAVAAGMTARQRRLLTDQLVAVGRRATYPFAGPPHRFFVEHARWVPPVLVGDVEYREFRGSLRHALWKGLRLDGPRHSARLARASTASNSTWQPASASSGMMLSASLWDRPSLQGVKIMAVGTRRAT